MRSVISAVRIETGQGTGQPSVALALQSIAADPVGG